MRYASLVAAGLVILASNAGALIHAAWNRRGVESECMLTDRELKISSAPTRNDSDNSAVELQLRWTNPRDDGRSFSIPSPWLDDEKLRSLGFDTSLPAADPRALEFYSRQLPRNVTIAFELNGPAWKLIESRPFAQESASRLVPIDADQNAQVLRTRHPDRTQVLILPGSIRIVNWSFQRPGTSEKQRLTGILQEAFSVVHVSRPLSDQFRGSSGSNRSIDHDPWYRVRVRFGKLLEPEVIAVEKR